MHRDGVLPYFQNIEKCDNGIIEQIDNGDYDFDVDDLNVTYRYTVDGDTVELHYISGCGQWYITVTDSYNEKVINHFGVENDFDVVVFINTVMSIWSY